MVRIKPGAGDEDASPAASASSGQSGPPQGVALSAIAIAALLAIGLVRQLFQLWGGAGGLSPIPGARPGFAPMLIAGYGIAWLCLWQYWKGKNWARILVLLWSFASAASAVSFLADHNLDPAALMSRPLNFFQALLAAVLLYWLNTPPVRGWFRKVSATAADLVGDRLVGRLCTGVACSAASWRLSFEHGAELILHCPWRIVLDNNLAFAHAPAAGSGALPHALTAGDSTLGQDLAPNPAPDSPDEARRLLQNLRVTGVRVAPHSSDLFVSFEMGFELQTWSPAPAAGSAHAPAAGSAALPQAPAAGSAALPQASAPQWQYRDSGLTVIADEEGLQPKFAQPQTPEAADEDARA